MLGVTWALYQQQIYTAIYVARARQGRAVASNKRSDMIAPARRFASADYCAQIPCNNSCTGCPHGVQESDGQTDRTTGSCKPGTAYLQGFAQGANLGLQAHVVIGGVAPLAAQRGHLPRQHALVRLHLAHMRHQPLVLGLQRIDLQGAAPTKLAWCDAG